MKSTPAEELGILSGAAWYSFLIFAAISLGVIVYLLWTRGTGV